MFTETRKIHLLKEVLNLDNETVLTELEAVLEKSKHPMTKRKHSAHDFAGVWSKEDTKLIEEAIAEGCEQIHPDDWK